MNLAKTIIALLFTLIVSASIPSPLSAAAATRPKPVTLGGFSLSPTIGWYIFKESEHRDSTPLYGLKIGYDKIATSIADNLGVEGSVNYFSTSSKAPAGDSSGYLLRLDALYPFVVAERWMPFLAVGGGGIFIDTGPRSESNFLFNYGAGLKYFMEDYLALRFDARHLIVYDDFSTRSNFEFGVGISYYFGKERKKKAVPPPAKPVSAIPALEDIDTTAGKKVAGESLPAAKYGKTDVLSVPLLALTPLLALESSARLPFQAEAPMESVGVKYMAREASPAEVQAVPAPAGEMPPIGVAPEKTPPSVAAIPAPVMTGEGKPVPVPTLPMAEGIAQSSPDGTEEPLPGAVEMIVIRKLPVKFDPDSTYIRPDFYAELVKLADIMKSSDSISARIEGQPDSMGDVKQNIRLTERRVERVRDSQINLGVNPDRISTEVHEPSRPIADSAPNQVVISLALTEGAQAVPAPAAAGAIPAPARVEKAPLKPGPASTPAGDKKPLPAAVPGVVPVPPAPAAAGAIPAPARVETAPLKPGPAPTTAGEKKPLPAAAPGAAPAPTATAPSPVTAGERPKPAPALPVTAPTAQPAPVVVEVPARQVVGKKVVRKLTVEFDVDSSYIKQRYYNKLSKIADIMKSSANSSARIAGHTDSSGRFSYNVKLSKQRAQSVRSSLIKLGVAPDRISTVGYGPSRPIADNATVEGKRRNRRAVTFVTLEIFE